MRLERWRFSMTFPVPIMRRFGTVFITRTFFDIDVVELTQCVLHIDFVACGEPDKYLETDSEYFGFLW